MPRPLQSSLCEYITRTFVAPLCERTTTPCPSLPPPSTDTQTDEVNALRKVVQFVPEIPDDETVVYESEVGGRGRPSQAIDA